MQPAVAWVCGKCAFACAFLLRYPAHRSAAFPLRIAQKVQPVTRPQVKLGASAVPTKSTWVQTERKAHEAWASLIARKPRSAQLLHHLVARMGHQNAVVVSQKTLAKIMGCSLRTTQYAIAALVEESWMSVVKLNGPGTVSAPAFAAVLPASPAPSRISNHLVIRSWKRQKSPASRPACRP